MQKLKFFKVLSLPTTLEPDSIYFVKIAGSSEMEVYTTNSTGTIFAHNLKQSVNELDYAYTGRAYVYANTWRGFNNTYGNCYYQFNQTMGSAATPSMIGARNGFLVPRKCVMQSLNIVGNWNAAAVFDFEFAVTCIEKKHNVNAANVVWVENFKGTSTGNTFPNILNFKIGQTCPEQSEIIVSHRTINGGGNRLFYMSANMKFIY